MLFIDGEAIVIDKPAGLPSIPARGRRESLEDHLRASALRLPAAAAAGPPARPRHPRLPAARPQSQGAQALPARVRGEAGRQDLCRGPRRRARGGERHDRPGARQDLDRRGRLADGRRSGRQGGGDATGAVAAVKDGRALILFTPETGRTHQIRVHAAAGLGIPIAGDPVYGAGRGPMLLHALSLRVEREGKPPVEATAPLPPTFAHAGFGDVGEPFELPEEALEREVPRRDRAGRAERQQGRDRVPAALRRLRARPRAGRLCAAEGAGRQPDDRGGRDRHHRAQPPQPGRQSRRRAGAAGGTDRQGPCPPGEAGRTTGRAGPPRRGGSTRRRSAARSRRAAGR